MSGMPEQSFIYVTPYLAEIARIREGCPDCSFLEPQYFTYTDDGDSVGCAKIDSFNALLRSGENIAVSHQTFLNSTSETVELIREYNYELIIDEALDAVIDFNQTGTVKENPAARIRYGDINMMLDKGLIEVDDTRNGLIQWVGTEEYGDWKNKEFETLVKLNRVYLVGKNEGKKNAVVTVFPPEIFYALRNVYVLTYMFDASTFRPYLDLFCVPYEVKTLLKADDGESYVISDYNEECDIAFREKVYDLVTLYPCKSGQYKGMQLSKSWYDEVGSRKGPKPEFERLGNNIQNFIKNKVKASAKRDEIMWTCYKEYRNAVQKSGFICSRSLNSDELSLPEEELKALQRRTSCFVPCNAKATNEYRNRWALAYCININMKPMITTFFSGHNNVRAEQGLPEISVNANLYSLSCLIQWMFRSRIRDEQPIHLYLPSPRMCNIFTSWLTEGVSGIKAA